MWAQSWFLHEHSKSFHFTKIINIDVRAKFAFEWPSLIGINTLTTQDNKIMTSSHFDIFLHILIISKLHSSCVYE